MSEAQPPSPPEPLGPKSHSPIFSGRPAPTPPASGRSGCAVALMIVAGIILLLPGICALAIIAPDPKEALNDSTSVMALLSFLLIAAGGVALIVFAVRRRNTGRRDI
jgi:hypothetical protein